MLISRKGRSLAAIALEANISYRTLQYWLERYRTSGLAVLARKHESTAVADASFRVRCKRRSKPLALEKPPLSLDLDPLKRRVGTPGLIWREPERKIGTDTKKKTSKKLVINTVFLLVSNYIEFGNFPFFNF